MLAIPATVAALLWAGMRAKEIAVQHARLACQRESVQFLDQTVALNSMRPARDNQGRFCWRRQYQFEFNSHDAYRDKAQLELLGIQAKHVKFPYQRDSEGNRVYQH